MYLNFRFEALATLLDCLGGYLRQWLEEFFVITMTSMTQPTSVIVPVLVSLLIEFSIAFLENIIYH